MNKNISLIVGALLTLGSAVAAAESGGHEHHMPEAEQEMEMSDMEMTPAMGQPMSHEMNHASHGAMQQQSPGELRDPHAWADGFGHARKLQLGDEHPMAGLMVERFEGVQEENNNFAVYELRGWYGYSYDRAVIKAEGDVDNGKVQEATTELLWSHAIAPFWNRQLGLRHDSGNEPNRNWLAIGIEGLAPYWFEIDATAYLGTEGRSAATLTAEYELLLTQRLILQPRIEANLYGKRDDERMQGSGLSDAVAGLRLRYEIRREFAPYIGIEWAGKLGSTADMARNSGVDTNEQRLVAGVRFWY